MGSFIIESPIPEDEIRKSAEEAREGLKVWFENNPKRRKCDAELWYGFRRKIAKKEVDEFVDNAMEFAIQRTKEMMVEP